MRRRVRPDQSEQRFSSAVSERRVTIHVGLSTQLASEFEDEYFDWIYVDTGHSYALTSEELTLYAAKVKHGGIIAGHDYVRWNRSGMIRFGVIEAVSEFCVKHDWEILYLTVENNNNPSFAIRKIEQ